MGQLHNTFFKTESGSEAQLKFPPEASLAIWDVSGINKIVSDEAARDP